MKRTILILTLLLTTALTFSQTRFGRGIKLYNSSEITDFSGGYERIPVMKTNGFINRYIHSDSLALKSDLLNLGKTYQSGTNISIDNSTSATPTINAVTPNLQQVVTAGGTYTGDILASGGGLYIQRRIRKNGTLSMYNSDFSFVGPAGKFEIGTGTTSIFKGNTYLNNDYGKTYVGGNLLFEKTNGATRVTPEHGGMFVDSSNRILFFTPTNGNGGGNFAFDNTAIPTSLTAVYKFQGSGGTLAHLSNIKTYQAGTNITIDNTNPQQPIINATVGAGGATNLGLTTNSNTVTITSSTGNNAVLPLATSTTAGLQKANFYDEGVWTPVLTSSNSSANFTYSSSNVEASYVRSGNLVHFNVKISGISYVDGSNTGIIQIEGLPFVCATDKFNDNSGAFSNTPASSGSIYLSKSGFINPNDNKIILRQKDSPQVLTGNLPVFSNGGFLVFSGTYVTNVYTP